MKKAGKMVAGFPLAVYALPLFIIFTGLVAFFQAKATES
jgi:hypothetical protein